MACQVAAIAMLVAASCVLTYYCHVVLRVEVIFTHFFYIPAILAALWWKRRGLFVAAFLAAMLIASHLFLRPEVTAADDYARALMLVVVAGVVAAVAERVVKKEQELREIRDYLENLIDHANAPIVVWDPSRVIVRFNRAFERLTGYPAGEAVGRGLTMLFPESAREESLRQIELTAQGEQWESVEIPILSRDGDVRLVLWNSANVYAGDGETLLSTIAQGVDITERKRAEQELQRTSYDLVEKVTELDRFVHIVSNDVKSLLASVREFTGSLRRNLGEDPTGELRDSISRIEANVDGTSSLLADLIELSRVGWLMPRPADVNLLSAVKACLQDFQAELDEAGAEVSINGCDCVVRYDPVRLDQLLRGLVKNAVKFSRTGEALRLEIECSEGENEIEVTVRDNGIGIAPEFHDKVFEVFTRLPGATGLPGIGIGLTIAKRIVESHGGRIWVVSDEGAGAEFHFTIPRKPGD